MVRQVSFCLLLVGCILSIAACEHRVNRDELYGTYQVQYPYGTEQLVITADGTYEQFFSAAGQPLGLINKGRWDFPGQGEATLNLSDPVIVDDGFGKRSQMKRVAGYWPLRVLKGLRGDIRMSINEDQGFVFKKLRRR
jgi:hypothetical protein